MARTEKAKGMNHLLKSVNDAPVPSDAKPLVIQGGNATFHVMTDIPSNFQLISYQILTICQSMSTSCSVRIGIMMDQSSIYEENNMVPVRNLII